MKYAVLFALVSVVLAGSACDGAGSPREYARTDEPPTVAAARGVTPAMGATSVLHGAGVDEGRKREIRIAAAADLRRVLTALQPAIERACDTKLVFVFGSSGTLKEQILAGADYHLFMSADTAFVEELDRAGKLVPGGSATYGVGRIVLAWRKDLAPIGTIADLGRGDIRRIAIANPGHAPYGRAAQQAMTSAGVWDGFQNRLVLGENIRQTTDYVEQGNADAGILALALVIDTNTPYRLIDASLHKPIIQGAGVVKGTGGELTARCALQQILDPGGQETLKRFGFEPVPSP